MIFLRHGEAFLEALGCLRATDIAKKHADAKENPACNGKMELIPQSRYHCE